MLSFRNLIAVVSTVAIVFAFADTSHAQRAPFKVNQAFRWMGHFQSTGYHWRNPGPCVGYYNPYSHHNSSLRIGGHPQGASSYNLNFYSDHHAGIYSEFDRPGGFTSPVAPADPTPNSTIDSEVDIEQYEESEATVDDGNVEEDAKSILDEIEAIDEDEKGPKESKKRVDGASIWSDVFELSRINQPKSKLPRTSNAVQRKRSR